MRKYSEGEQSEAQCEAELLKAVAGPAFGKFVQSRQGVSVNDAFIWLRDHRSDFVVESDVESTQVFGIAMSELFSTGALANQVNLANQAQGFGGPGVSITGAKLAPVELAGQVVAVTHTIPVVAAPATQAAVYDNGPTADLRSSTPAGWENGPPAAAPRPTYMPNANGAAPGAGTSYAAPDVPPVPAGGYGSGREGTTGSIPIAGGPAATKPAQTVAADPGAPGVVGTQPVTGEAAPPGGMGQAEPMVVAGGGRTWVPIAAAAAAAYLLTR